MLNNIIAVLLGALVLLIFTIAFIAPKKADAVFLEHTYSNGVKCYVIMADKPVVLSCQQTATKL